MNSSVLHCPLCRTRKNIYPWGRTAQAALSSHANMPLWTGWTDRGQSQSQLQNYHGNPVLMTHVSSHRPTVLSPLLYNSLEGLKMPWYREEESTDQRWHFRTEQGPRHVPKATGSRRLQKGHMMHCVWLSATPWTVQPTRLLCPWHPPGKHTGVGCHFLLQGIFLTLGSSPGLPPCRRILHHLSHQGQGIQSGSTA